MAIDLDSIKTRVEALNLFTSVQGVANAAEALENGARPPAAFVAVSSERAAPNKTQGVHDQRVDATIAVLMCLAAQRADNRRADVAEDTRLAVIPQLAGWTPTGARMPFDYDSYRVIRMGGGLIWLECSFRTSWVLRVP